MRIPLISKFLEYDKRNKEARDDAEIKAALKFSNTCVSCIYYKTFGVNYRQSFGSCRHGPPTSDLFGNAVFPAVECDDWCHQHKPKDSK
jgi:hypothetical protein